jgi:hypothetical protein
VDKGVEARAAYRGGRRRAPSRNVEGASAVSGILQAAKSLAAARRIDPRRWERVRVACGVNAIPLLVGPLLPLGATQVVAGGS